MLFNELADFTVLVVKVAEDPRLSRTRGGAVGLLSFKDPVLAEYALFDLAFFPYIGIVGVLIQGAVGRQIARFFGDVGA